MRDLQWIKDSSDPNLQQFRQLRMKDSRGCDKVLLDGAKVIRRYHEQYGVLDRLLAKESFYDELADVSAHARYVSSRDILSDIVGYSYHQGAIGVGSIPGDFSLDQFGDRVMVLNGICQPENVGAMMRLAHGFGFDSILYDEESCTPFARRAVRVSMGNVFYLKTRRSPNLVDELNQLKERGYQVVGTSPYTSVNADAFRPAPKLVLVFGSEGHGMSEDIFNTCDVTVKIPLTDTTDSLNVTHAAAILCHQFSSVKKRRIKKP